MKWRRKRKENELRPAKETGVWLYTEGKDRITMDDYRAAQRAGASLSELAEMTRIGNEIGKSEAKGFRHAQEQLTNDIRGRFDKTVGRYEGLGGLVVSRLFVVEAVVRFPGVGSSTLRLYEDEEGRLWEKESEANRGRSIDPRRNRAVFWSGKVRRPWVLRAVDPDTAALVRASLAG